MDEHNNKITNIYNKIINNTPFCFIRINDGETNVMMSNTAVASRGDEIYSIELSDKLHYIVNDTWENDNLYIGIPCINCYNTCYNYVKNALLISKTSNFIKYQIVDNNILINNNYDTTLDILMTYLVDRNVIIVANELAIHNIKKLVDIGIPIDVTYVVTSKYAFNNDYDKLKDLQFINNSFIITLCGPLGRVLSYEWYKNNNTLSCIDLGSFFDPLLCNKSYLYHTNNHKYCNNCYPNTSTSYSKIFNFCSNVKKECYYLDTLTDNLNLYNNDYNRIILNTDIRLENEPLNFNLQSIILYCKIKLIFPNKSQLITDYSKLIQSCKQKNPKKVLEIGFEISSILFLEYSQAYITSINDVNIDINNIQTKYDNRLEYIKGINEETISSLVDRYDLIYINSTGYNFILSLITNCFYKSTSDTLLIVTNNIENINAYKKCVDDNFLIPIHNETSDNIIIFKYNHSINESNIIKKYMGKCNYIINIINECNTNEIKKITTYIEEYKLLDIKPLPLEGFAFQIYEQFDDLMNFCHVNSFSKILEIGFLHGSSSLLFLINTDANVTSIDYIENNISEQYLLNKFSNRFNIVHGNSNDILKSLADYSYDLLYIDGGHDYITVKNDILTCQYLLNEDCIIIMNDVVTNPDFCMFWNTGPTKLYNELDKIELFNKIYSKGRGMVIFKLKKNTNTLSINKNDMHSDINFIINSKTTNPNTLKKLNILTTEYLKYFSIILSNEEYELFRYHNIRTSDSILDLEQFISERYISNKIKNEALMILKNHYNNINTKILIPKIIHLIYINQRPLNEFNYKCIYSIIKHMPEYIIYIHNDIEPDTPEWNILKQINNIIIKQIKRIKTFDNINIEHVQYEADIIRMNVLYEYGGIYMDNDIYIVKNINPLITENGLYIAKENKNDFINCVIISEPRNEFLKIWLNNFSTGFKIGMWGWHIRELPKLLLNNFKYYEYKYNIHILDYENFCPIPWTHGHMFNDPNFQLTEKIYGIHLFETIFGNSLNNSVIINY